MGRIRERKHYALRLEEQLQGSMERILSRRRHELDLYVERMKGLSPLEKLKSGFSYVEDEKGRNIRSVEGVSEGQQMTIHVRDGRIQTQVTQVHRLDAEYR